MITVYDKTTRRPPYGEPTVCYAYVRSFPTYPQALAYAVLDAVKFGSDPIIVEVDDYTAPDLLPLSIVDDLVTTVEAKLPHHNAGPLAAELGDIDI